MEKDFTLISELRAIREEKEKLSRKEAELSRSTLSDLDLIPLLYKWYGEIQTNRKHPVKEGTVKFKKQFLYVILFLYTPITLAGGVMGRGIRNTLSRIFGFRSPTYVSNLCNGAVMEYLHYKDFRRDVNGIYKRLLQRMYEEGVI